MESPKRGGPRTSAPVAAPPVSFWRRQRDDLLRDMLVGAVALGAGFGLAAWWDARLGERTEAVENTRFVREVAVSATSAKPFNGLRLHGANLSGLDLGCDDPASARAAAFVVERLEAGCADLRGADVTDAVLVRTDLSYALLSAADLRRADLTLTSLTGADMASADLRGAVLFKTDLTAADLTAADLADVRWAYVCWDDATVWPQGFRPPEEADCTDSGERIRMVDEG